jgi:hypothetical protein
MDNYKPGNTSLQRPSGANLSRSDTQSFGESQAFELHSHGAAAGHPGLPMTPPPQAAFHVADTEKARDATHSPPIDPSTLNQSPAPIPEGPVSPIPRPVESVPPVAIPAAAPTVAETGVPVSAGASGPGPASGSLRDIHRASDAAGPRSGGLPGKSPFDDLYGQPHSRETAADEKKRLEREERERVLATGTSGAAPPAASEPESAEDEKKRLEREERARVSASAASGDAPSDVKDHGDELPPYQDMQE